MPILPALPNTENLAPLRSGLDARSCSIRGRELPMVVVLPVLSGSTRPRESLLR